MSVLTTQGVRMGDDKEEMMLSWCFRKEQIENSPSRRDGISADVEAQIRLQYCQFIRWLCAHFKLDTIPTATAVMFCHRFYALQSLAKNDWKTIATACVFLSSKSEDSYRSLDDMMKIAFTSDVQKLPTESQQRKEFLQKKRELIELAEKMLLINFRFDTNVNHPYRPLHDAMKLVGINSKDLRREVWKLVNCWLDTTLCLEYKPEWIAAASLHILDKLNGLKLSDVRGLLSLWSEKFVPEKWDECISQMVQILCARKWPHCAKLTDGPSLPQPEPELKPKQATSSISELPEPELEPEENKPMIVTPDSVLDMAAEASKMQETASKRHAVILDPSSSSEDAPEKKPPETKEEGICKVLDSAYIACIREAIRKRKSTKKMCPIVGKAKMEASTEGMDDWIERELESGIIVESEPVCEKAVVEQTTAAILGNKCDGSDDSWIEKLLEECIIVNSKPVAHSKMESIRESRAALKLEKYCASKPWRLLKREREAEVNLSSKREREAEVNLSSKREREAEVNLSSKREREAEVNLSSKRERKAEVNLSSKRARETEVSLSNKRQRR